jgi:DtxR family Mn-dependent transcriptional regulator
MSTEAVETGACEFEHMAADEVTDSICTLLGHPRTCIHGMPIPEGSCCRAAEGGLPASVIPLADAPVGASVKIALVDAPKDGTHHRLAHLDLVPGTVVRVHQRRPSVVVAHGDNLVAMDEGLARRIHVWVGRGDEGAGEPRQKGLARAVWEWLNGTERD